MSYRCQGISTFGAEMFGMQTAFRRGKESTAQVTTRRIQDVDQLQEKAHSWNYSLFLLSWGIKRAANVSLTAPRQNKALYGLWELHHSTHTSAVSASWRHGRRLWFLLRHLGHHGLSGEHEGSH